MRSWFLALKNYSEEFIINSAMEYHHVNQFAPNSPSQMLEVMKAKYQAAKLEQQAQARSARTTEDKRHTQVERKEHEAVMRQLDEQRKALGLEAWDEKKYQGGEMILNPTAKNWLNVLYRSLGKKEKYPVG